MFLEPIGLNNTFQFVNERSFLIDPDIINYFTFEGLNYIYDCLATNL